MTIDKSKIDLTRFKVETIKSRTGVEVELVRRIDPCLFLDEFVKHIDFFAHEESKDYRVKIGFIDSREFYDYLGTVQIDPINKEFRLIIDER